MSARARFPVIIGSWLDVPLSGWVGVRVWTGFESANPTCEAPRRLVRAAVPLHRRSSFNLPGIGEAVHSGSR